jgi:Protein of unknown function (DUF993)
VTQPAAASLTLPRPDGTLARYTLGPPSSFPRPAGPARSRVAFAAAHVVADPLAPDCPVTGPAAIDWDATLAFRRHLWSWGLGVAEAMDTAQRGMGLDHPAAMELIRRSAAEARALGGAPLACGAGTDQLPAGEPATLDRIVAAYEAQCAWIEDAGAQVVLMASRALAATARDADDYAEVYARVLPQLDRPAILHWLGEAFDPALAGYWGGRDLDDATGSLLAIINQHADRVDGVKVSLLDAEREVELRRKLPDGVRLYTGDDFNYPELIRGDDQGYSDALLGIFDPIAPAAAAALAALDAGDRAGFDRLLAPTLPLARHLFASPTFNYKTGVVFLAWLGGHQPAFRMLGGQESARSLPHLAELLMRADRAGLLADPELAAARMRALLSVAGVDQAGA